MAGGNRNTWLAFGLVGIIAGMTGLSFAAVPLYRIFCAATGYGGTPQIGPEASPGEVNRTIVVRFNANVNTGMPWQFAPDQPQMTVKLGDEQPASYHARNLANVPIEGVATYNITPEKAAIYFHKTQCFCFSSQTLQPGQEADFPLSFWVDPAIAKDVNTQDVTTITLSYTFFHSLNDAARTGALAKAGPHVGGGEKLPTATP
jgi:cytochrome c oxidase assembly protein subunit 11